MKHADPTSPTDAKESLRLALQGTYSTQAPSESIGGRDTDSLVSFCPELLCGATWEQHLVPAIGMSTSPCGPQLGLAYGHHFPIYLEKRGPGGLRMHFGHTPKK